MVLLYFLPILGIIIEMSTFRVLLALLILLDLFVSLADMHTRSFVRYLANITIKLRFPLYRGEIYTDVEFIAPFCERALKANVTPWMYFPKKFVNVEITSYKIIQSSVPNNDDLLFNPRCCHNYQQIIQMIIRNVIFVLGFDYYLNHFKNE